MFFNKILKSLLIFLLLGTNFVLSQEQKEPSNFWNNVRFGGGLGLNFGDDFFYGSISPSGIYEFNNYFALGLGLNATFINQKNSSKSTILGGSLISLFNVVPEFQISAELEQLNVSTKYSALLDINDENYWIPALFIGAGYRSNNATIGLRYDLLYNDDKSLYISPWVPFLRFYF